MPLPRWHSMVSVAPHTARGSVTWRISAVMAPAEATTAGCISAEPAEPPNAAITVKSSGKSPCMPLDIRSTDCRHRAVWSLRSLTRNTQIISMHTTCPASLFLPSRRHSRLQISAGAARRVSRHRLPVTAEQNRLVISCITWSKSRVSWPRAMPCSVCRKPPVAAKGSDAPTASSCGDKSRPSSICVTPSVRVWAAAGQGMSASSNARASALMGSGRAAGSAACAWRAAPG